MPDSTLKPFSTNDCSGGVSKFWRLVFRRPPTFEWCCRKHDGEDVPEGEASYHRGGTREERLKRDAEILSCVALGEHSTDKKPHPYVAILMFIVVRFGGHPLMPLPKSRWGYGYRWPQSGRKGVRYSNKPTGEALLELCGLVLGLVGVGMLVVILARALW